MAHVEFILIIYFYVNRIFGFVEENDPPHIQGVTSDRAIDSGVYSSD